MTCRAFCGDATASDHRVWVHLRVEEVVANGCAENGRDDEVCLAKGSQLGSERGRCL